MATVENVNPNTIFYIYHEESKLYVGEGNTGDGFYCDIPENSTLLTPTFQEDFVPAFDEENDEWVLIIETCHFVNDEGFHRSEDDNMLDDTRYPEYTKVEVPLPELTEEQKENKHFLNFNQNTQSWDYISFDIYEFLKPVFNTDTRLWEEGSSEGEYNWYIDKQTSAKIKDWCRTEKGKNEEYYLNKGIQDKEDIEYLEYYAKREELIASQALLKFEGVDSVGPADYSPELNFYNE